MDRLVRLAETTAHRQPATLSSGECTRAVKSAGLIFMVTLLQRNISRFTEDDGLRFFTGAVRSLVSPPGKELANTHPTTRDAAKTLRNAGNHQSALATLRDAQMGHPPLRHLAGRKDSLFRVRPDAMKQGLAG